MTILGDTQKPALGDPALAGGLDQMTSRGPFQPQLFCDSGPKNTTTTPEISGMKRERNKTIFTQRFRIETLTLLLMDVDYLMHKFSSTETSQCIICSKIKAIDWSCFTNMRRYCKVPLFVKAIFLAHVSSAS